MTRFILLISIATPLTAAATGTGTGIFNIPAKPSRPELPARQIQATPLPPASMQLQPPETLPHTHLAQFERQPNESDKIYSTRMQLMYQQAARHLIDLNQQHLEKMQALRPG